MNKPSVVSIYQGLNDVTYMPNRTPEMFGANEAFIKLADYREGGIWVGHYAGNSEWERHPVGDEFLQIIGGETTLILLIDDKEVRRSMKAGELAVVPQSVWHRFETPNGVKILTITPQPSEHQLERPE